MVIQLQIIALIVFKVVILMIKDYNLITKEVCSFKMIKLFTCYLFLYFDSYLIIGGSGNYVGGNSDNRDY